MINHLITIIHCKAISNKEIPNVTSQSGVPSNNCCYYLWELLPLSMPQVLDIIQCISSNRINPRMKQQGINNNNKFLVGCY
jgi:hypothetical protein